MNSKGERLPLATKPRPQGPRQVTTYRGEGERFLRGHSHMLWTNLRRRVNRGKSPLKRYADQFTIRLFGGIILVRKRDDLGLVYVYCMQILHRRVVMAYSDDRPTVETPSVTRDICGFGVGHDMKKSDSQDDESPSQLIDARIEELSDWRGETLARMRGLIKEADPDVVEEWKWSGPAWSHDGVICTGETYKNKVKLTFPKGASLEDPVGLFNASLDGNVRRAIDIHEEDEINEKAFMSLVRSAAVVNES